MIDRTFYQWCLDAAEVWGQVRYVPERFAYNYLEGRYRNDTELTGFCETMLPLLTEVLDG